MSDKGTKVVAIVQARMGSTRLPGKVMMDLCGEPMLLRVHERLNACRLLDDIVIATSRLAADDAIEQLCLRAGIKCYRGDEQDVLDRYMEAARTYEADVVVRITSDCPLIDPAVTDSVIEAYLKDGNGYDGATNTVLRTYPRGLDTEVISTEALEKVWRDAKEPYQREHVTIYAYENPEIFRIKDVTGASDLSELRWTVDEEEDIRFAREVYSRLYSPGKLFLMDDVLKLLSTEPQLQAINEHIRQKAAK